MMRLVPVQIDDRPAKQLPLQSAEVDESAVRGLFWMLFAACAVIVTVL